VGDKNFESPRTTIYVNQPFFTKRVCPETAPHPFLGAKNQASLHRVPVDKAEGIAKSLAQRFPSGTLAQDVELPAFRAALSLQQGNPAQALEELKPALRYELSLADDDCLRMYPVYLRGVAYLRLEKAGEAAGEFQRIIEHSGVVLDCATLSLSHLHLARAYAVMGDNETARKSYQDFLTLWKDAGPDIPIRWQAKVEYAKLIKLPATSRELPAKSSQLSAASHH